MKFFSRSFFCFSDVAASHWAAGYVNVASNYGIIKGVGANMFAPDKEVSVAEFYTMAIRALGAGMLVDSEGTWPTNYVNFAIENGLAEDVAQVYSATSTRITAAIIAANTLEANMWKKSSVRSNGEIEWTDRDGETIINNVLKYTTEDSNGHALSLTVKAINTKDNFVTDNTTTAGVDHEVAENVDLSTLKVGMTYEYWTNKDGEIAGFWIPVEKESIEFTEIKEYKENTGKDEIKVVVDGKEKSYTIDDVTNDGAQTPTLTKLPVVVINEKSVAFAKTDLAKNKNLDGVLYLEDGIVSSIYLTTFNKYGIVDEVTDKKIKFETTDITVVKDLAASDFRIDDEDIEYVLTKDGNAINFSDLEEGDAIRYYEVKNSSNNVIKVVAEQIEVAAEGKITNINEGSQYIKIDGTKYDWEYKKPASTTQTQAEKDASLQGLELEKEVEIYTNQAGKVVMYKTIKEAKGDVAVVKYMKKITDKYGEDNAEVKLFFMDGTVSDTLTVDLKKTAEKYGDSLTASIVRSSVTAPTTVSINTSTVTTIGIGSVVCYSIADGKIVFKPVTSTDKEYEALATNDKLVINENTASYIMKGSNKAFVDENTKFIEIKNDDNDEVKVAFVNFDDLGVNKTGYALTNADTVVNFDADDKSVSALVYRATINSAKENNFAVVVAKSATKVDDDKDAMEYDVIYTDGTKATLFGTDADFGTGYDQLNVGTAYDIAVTGDRLTSAECGTGKDVWALTILTYLTDNDTKHREITDGTNTYNVSEDVLVLLKDGSKYTVKDITDIDDYSETPDANEEIDTIISAFGANDDDDHEQAVVIIYEVAKYSN